MCLFLFNVYEFCLHVGTCALWALYPRSPWNWRGTWLWASMQMLRNKPRSPGRAVWAFKCWAISPDPIHIINLENWKKSGTRVISSPGLLGWRSALQTPGWETQETRETHSKLLTGSYEKFLLLYPLSKQFFVFQQEQISIPWVDPHSQWSFWKARSAGLCTLQSLLAWLEH